MKDLSKEELEQLIPVFRDQSLHIIEEMGQDMLALESGKHDGELIIRLKRAAHTIKGDSACIGLDGVTNLAHQLEDIIDAVGHGEIPADRRVID
ncbi:MAG TPA: Hpt domain-containing protein, partial [Bacteroidota bacterium]